jgi:alpha-tubulin suppressor-like RCC1 family protein
MKRCLFALGSGLHGQLGLGRSVMRASEPVLVSIGTDVDGDVDQVAASADASFAVLAKSKQTVQVTNSQRFSPKAKISNDIVKLSCGKRHLMILDSSGSVHGAGSNDSGQLGTRSSASFDTDVSVVEHSPMPAPVVDVAAGLLHSLAVTSDGALFSCGASSFNELGHASIDHESRWRRVEALAGESIVGCAAGALHSVAWTSNGRLFSFGRNDRGQLGTKQAKFGLLDEVRLPAPARFATCGQAHTLVVTVDGRTFVCGDNEMYQLGSAVTAPFSGELVPVGDLPTAIVGVSCGSYHSLAWTVDGRLYGWGCGNDGQLGATPESAAVRSVREIRSNDAQWQHIESAAGGFGLTLAISRSKPIISD